MWIAKLVKSVRNGKRLDVLIEYTDGTETFTDVLPVDQVPSDDFINKLVATRISQLDNQDTLKGKLVDNTAIIPAVTPTPTPAEQVRQAYRAQILLVKRLLAAVALGALPANDKQVTDAQEQLRTDFKPEYIDLFF